MTKIFISYRRDDSAYIAGIIFEKIEQRFGADSIFFDIDTIPLGTDFRKHISDSVRKCDVLLTIIGDSWINAVNDQGSKRLDDPTDFVRLEIESALTRDIPVIPVLVGKARMPSVNELPSSLQELAFRNATEVRAGHDLQQHLARLVKGIETLHQPNSSKIVQTGFSSHQSNNKELVATNTPKVSTTISNQSPPKNGLRKPSWKRWVFSLIILIIFVSLGFGVGQLIFENDGNPFIGAVPTWLLGIYLTYKVWKRYSPA